MWFTSIKEETETKRGDSLELSRFFVLGEVVKGYAHRNYFRNYCICFHI